MKLSEMSTEQFADAMLTLAPAVASIAEDKAITQVMDNIAKKSRGDALEFAGAIAREAVPALLKEHRADMYVILSAGSPQRKYRPSRSCKRFMTFGSCWTRICWIFSRMPRLRGRADHADCIQVQAAHPARACLPDGGGNAKRGVAIKRKR